MTAAALARAEEALAQVLGLRVETSMRGRLQRCLQEGAAARRVGVEEFSARLEGDDRAIQELIDRVTVQETWFFREPDQIDAFARHVVPAPAPETLRVWSAGCANGQEAYSLAMALEEVGCSDWEVLATDVSSRALGRAQAGRYSDQELRGLSEERRRRFLVRAGRDWEVRQELRERVRIRRHNLVLDPPPEGTASCLAVFCRNVLIYLRPQQAEAVLTGMARLLAPGSTLFLASADHAGAAPAGLELVRIGSVFAYRRGAEDAAPGGASVAEPGPSTARRRAPSAAADPGHRPPAPRGPQRTQATARPAPSQPPPAPPRARPAAPGPAPAPSRAVPADVAALLRGGETALAGGDVPAAIRAFRQAAFLDPDLPVAHCSLGLALELAGELDAASRAFSAARSALARSDPGAVESGLDGFSAGELAAFLSARLRGRP